MTAKVGNKNNESYNLEVGDLAIAMEPGRVVMGKITFIEYPAISIRGELFPENSIYKANEERLIQLGVPGEVIKKFFSEDNPAPYIKGE